MENTTLTIVSATTQLVTSTTTAKITTTTPASVLTLVESFAGISSPILQASDTVMVIGGVFNILFLIPFIFDICKPKSKLRSPYFLLIGATTFVRTAVYSLHFIRLYVRAIVRLNQQRFNDVYEIAANLPMHFHGIIILALAANRATALIFLFKHKAVRIKEKRQESNPRLR